MDAFITLQTETLLAFIKQIEQVKHSTMLTGTS